MNPSNDMDSKLNTLLDRLKQREVSPSALDAMRPHLDSLKSSMEAIAHPVTSKAAIIHQPDVDLTTPPHLWRWTAGIGLAALVLFWITFEIHRPSGQLFAQVIDRILQANGYVISVDIRSHQIGALSPDEEQTRIAAIKSMAKQDYLNQQLMLLKDLETTPLGNRQENRLLLSGFEIHRQDVHYTVWADSRSGDPFEMKLEGSYEGGPSWSITLNEFVFDASGTSVRTRITSEFGNHFQTETSGSITGGSNTTTGVGGFVMASSDGSSHVTATQVTEHQGEFDVKIFIVSLERLLETNQGAFPDQLDPPAFMETYFKQHQLQLPLSAGEQKQFQQALNEGAIAFSAPHQLRGRDWHYQGKGIRFGERKAVCWWQEKNDDLYTIVYGDLSFETNTKQP